MPHEEFLAMMVLLLSAIGLVFFFAGPIRKALLRKIEGQLPAHDPQLLEEFDHLRERVGDLEERLDFTERLLARQRETAELPPGGVR